MVAAVSQYRPDNGAWDADKIAVQNLIWTVVAAAAGVISAVAAVVAARYAKGSATQRSLEVVEANTASAADTIIEVCSHLAKVEDHLRFQNDQHVLALLGQRASIRVYGEDWTDEPMMLKFTVATPQFVLTGVDLLNESGQLHMCSCGRWSVHRKRAHYRFRAAVQQRNCAGPYLAACRFDPGSPFSGAEHDGTPLFGYRHRQPAPGAQVNALLPHS